jgi:hypothetical protein
MTVDDRLKEAFSDRTAYVEDNVQTLTKLSEFRSETGQNPKPEGRWHRSTPRLAVAAVIVLGLVGMVALISQLGGVSDDKTPSVATNPDTGLVSGGLDTPCNLGRFRVTVPSGWEHTDDAADCLVGSAVFDVRQSANIARTDRPLATLAIGGMTRVSGVLDVDDLGEVDVPLDVDGVLAGRTRLTCPPESEPCVESDSYVYTLVLDDEFVTQAVLDITPEGNAAGIDSAAVLASVDGLFEESFELVDEVPATAACDAAPTTVSPGGDPVVFVAALGRTVASVDLDGDGVLDEVTIQTPADAEASRLGVNFSSGGRSMMLLDGVGDPSLWTVREVATANQVWVSEIGEVSGFDANPELRQLTLTDDCGLALVGDPVALADLPN